MSRRNPGTNRTHIEWALEFHHFVRLLEMTYAGYKVPHFSRRALHAEITKLMAVELMNGVPPP